MTTKNEKQKKNAQAQKERDLARAKGLMRIEFRNLTAEHAAKVRAYVGKLK